MSKEDHKHAWQFAKFTEKGIFRNYVWHEDEVAIFICECGAVKQVFLWDGNGTNPNSDEKVETNGDKR